MATATMIVELNYVDWERFKEFLEGKDMLEKWYVYSDEQAAKALREWCETEGLSLEKK